MADPLIAPEAGMAKVERMAERQVPQGLGNRLHDDEHAQIDGEGMVKDG